jgi:hypothetical protein
MCTSPTRRIPSTARSSLISSCPDTQIQCISINLKQNHVYQPCDWCSIHSNVSELLRSWVLGPGVARSISAATLCRTPIGSIKTRAFGQRSTFVSPVFGDDSRERIVDMRSARPMIIVWGTLTGAAAAIVLSRWPQWPADGDHSVRGAVRADHDRAVLLHLQGAPGRAAAESGAGAREGKNPPHGRPRSAAGTRRRDGVPQLEGPETMGK